MKARLVNLDEDYAMLCAWWKAHGWDDGLPRHALPPIGIVVTDDKDKPLSAGFLYNCDGTSFGLIEWVVSNPDISGRLVYKSIFVLLGELKELAFKTGSFLLTAGVHKSHRGLAKLYEKCGFQTVDNNMIGLIHNIGG